jgi:dynein heavy chain
MQISCANGDLTTTWIPFHFFLNTRAVKSLAYGPGLLRDSVAGSDVEFVIQARNDMCENRQSGNDTFEVKITREGPPKEEGGRPEQIEVACNITDRNDGSYNVKYCVEEECEVKIRINFLDDKQTMVPIRGSPYSASFKVGGKPADNTMTGNAMQKVIQKELERLQTQLTDNKKAIATKDKDLKDVKVLLGVKSSVEETQNKTDVITLQIDQLEEALKTF